MSLKAKPFEFVDFAKNKITTQWCEPTFQTFWMLQAMDNHAEWSKVAKSIEKGKANKIIFVIMKLYLIFIWLGNLAYLIAKRKTAYHLEPVTTGGSTWRLHIPFPVGCKALYISHIM